VAAVSPNAPDDSDPRTHDGVPADPGHAANLRRLAEAAPLRARHHPSAPRNSPCRITRYPFQAVKRIPTEAFHLPIANERHGPHKRSPCLEPRSAAAEPD
jgi:hypothetical protein